MSTHVMLLAAGDGASGAMDALRVFGAAVVLVGFGLLATTNHFSRLQRHRVVAALVAGGWPAVAAGWTIGPGALDLVSDGTVLLLRPLLMACLGWVGVIVGMQLRRELLAAVPPALWRWALLDAIIAGGIATAAAAAIMHAWFSPGMNGVAWWLTPAALVGAATIGWSPETRSMRAELTPSTQRLALVLQGGAGLACVLAILWLGVCSQLVAPDMQGEMRLAPLLALRTLAFTVAASVALGLGGAHLLRLAGRRRGVLLVVFLGVVAMAAGFAADLGFSPLLMALLTGAALAAFGRETLPAFERLLMRGEHVVALLLGLLAGVLLTPVLDGWAWALVAAIVAVRVAAKPALTLRFLERITEGRSRRSPLRFATIRQSPLAPVLAVSLVLVYDAPVSRAVLTAIVFAGLLSDVVPLLVRYRRHRDAGQAPAASEVPS